MSRTIDAETQHHGTVAAWCGSYGFIAGDNVRGDVFVHFTAIRGDGFRQLNIGERVSFELGHDDRGRPKALNVSALQ